MFLDGHKYRHINTLDVDVFVMKVQYHGPKYYKLRVQWINRHNKDIQYDIETITVKKEDVDKWELVCE